MVSEVIVHGRDAGRGAQTVEEIERSGGKARFLAADLGNPAEIRRLANASMQYEASPRDEQVEQYEATNGVLRG